MPVFTLPNQELILVGLMVLGLLMLAWAIYSEMRLRKFIQGKNGHSLESIIMTIQKEHKELGTFKKQLATTLTQLHKRIEGSVRGISTIRYNAFGGRGESGAQSFATAILNEKGEGVVMSSIHTRDSTRVYAKPLVKFESKHELSEEEKGAVNEAKTKTKK